MNLISSFFKGLGNIASQIFVGVVVGVAVASLTVAAPVAAAAPVVWIMFV